MHQSLSTSRFIGGMLLIIGTSIGGGMLALPINNAGMGFIDSSVFLFFSWLVMTAGALLILEVNLKLPSGSNIISMAEATLGRPGKIIAWISYLFLMYALLSAYTAGGADVFGGIINLFGVHLPEWLRATTLVFLLGLVVYNGIKSVDYFNRSLMLLKFITYFFLVAIIFPHITIPHLQGHNNRYVLSSIMVLITSFGFANIVPSLRVYFNDNTVQLKKAILIGSLVPLVFYIIWDAVIIGVIPRIGDHGLIALSHSNAPVSSLTSALNNILHSHIITDGFRFFTSICMFTAFLGISISLIDFLADGLSINKYTNKGYLLYLIAFVPPLLLVTFSPGLFVHALAYAGIFCIILLVLLPVMMAWSGRYNKQLVAGYQMPGGKTVLLALVVVSFALLFIAIQY